MDSVVFARRKGFAETLTAAELEMMNLTGDGNGYDMITMPREWRGRVPTANFFQRGGYRDNPVAQRNNVVAKLIARPTRIWTGKPDCRARRSWRRLCAECTPSSGVVIEFQLTTL